MVRNAKEHVVNWSGIEIL